MKKSLLSCYPGSLVLIVMLVAVASAFAQSTPPNPPSCYPVELRGSGTDFVVRALNTGYVACWNCPDGSKPFIVGDLNTVLRNVGDRLDTVKNAALTAATPAIAASAADASWRRNVSKNAMTDPAFVQIREELRARQLCGLRPAAAASTPG